MTAAGAAADKQASDILLIHVGDLLGITDWFLLLSARNDRHLKTVSDEVEQRLRTGLERRPHRREGEADTGWVVLDYGDVVVHAFTATQRAYYQLERLWSDAPCESFEAPQAPRTASG